MRPARALPGKNQPVPRAPEDLVFRLNAVKDAARAIPCAKNGPRRVGAEIKDANRPGLTLPPGPPLHSAARRNAQVGDPRTVRRPDRIGIVIYARVDISHAVLCRAVQSDEAMVSAHAHKGELAPIGRPRKRFRTPLLLKSLFRRFTCWPHQPDLPGTKKRDSIALGRDCGRLPLGQFSSRRAVEINAPNILPRLRDKEVRIRIRATILKVAASRKQQITAVRRPDDLINLLPVIRFKGSQLASLPVRRAGDPEVAPPLLIF